MGSQEEVTIGSRPCPCGLGQVRVVLTYEDTDWGSRGHDWHGRIECEACSPLYTFIQVGRGADLVRIEDKRRCDDILREVTIAKRQFLDSEAVEAVFDALVSEFDALPTIAARYRLAVKLGLETATQGTFRNHTRHMTTRGWLNSLRHMWRLPKLFEHVGADPACISQAEARISFLERQAADALPPVLSLGPISIFAGGTR